MMHGDDGMVDSNQPRVFLGKPVEWDDDMGHKWQRDDEDEIDMFAVSSEFHNGPRCQTCGYAFCHHCQVGPATNCPGRPMIIVGGKP